MKAQLTPEKALAKAVQQATTLGALFYVRGAEVEIVSPAPLPTPLQASLQADPVLLHHHCGGDAGEAVALSFWQQLDCEYVVAKSALEFDLAIGRLSQDVAEFGGVVALDVETAPLPEHRKRAPVAFCKTGQPKVHQPDPDPAMVAVDPHRSRIVLAQVYAGGGTVWLFRGAALDLLVASSWLRQQRLVAHHAGFELGFLRRYGDGFGTVECSMQATGLLQGVRRRGLAEAVAGILGVTMPKDFGSSDWSAPTLSPGQLAYAAADAVMTYRLWQRLRAGLYHKGRERPYSLQRNAIPAVIAMQSRGMALDVNEHARQHRAWDVELSDARRAYLDMTGEAPPANRDDVRAWIERVADADRLARWPRTERDNLLSTAAGALKRLVHVPSARPVLKILHLEKLISSFGAMPKFVNPVTGRMHASFIISGSKAGRFTCNSPNLQQLPAQTAPGFRKVIPAAPGYVLVGCDWNQVEMRVAAWISGDPAMTAIYADGRDLHTITAAATCGIDPEQVTAEQRMRAKPTNFGSIYGIGARKLAEDAFNSYGIDMSVDEAQQSLDAFFALFSVFDSWRYQNYDDCMRKHMVTIGCGRVVEASWYSGYLDFPQCCNFPLQGACADAMLRAITWSHHRLIDAGIRGGLVATIHDELLAEVVEDDAEQTRDILEQAMTDAFVRTFPDAPTVNLVQARIGATWFDTH